jgi:hypothetical protein
MPYIGRLAVRSTNLQHCSYVTLEVAGLIDGNECAFICARVREAQDVEKTRHFSRFAAFYEAFKGHFVVDPVLFNSVE